MNQENKVPHRNIVFWPVHIVYRLHGSIPKQVIEQMILTREKLCENKPVEYAAAFRGEWMEKRLEEELHKSNGPYHLRNKKMVESILDSLHWIVENRNVYLFAACIMSNHVHLLLRSQNDQSVDIGKLIKEHKSFTARYCNKLLGKEGEPFWERGYFDRDLRDGQFTQLLWYIIQNPVKAGLVSHWKKWQGTYLNPDYYDVFSD